MQAVNALTGKIRQEIAEHGVLSFARFMELALYCPDCGYYEAKRDNIGRRGDFYTSVSVGSLFGEMLAFQFSEWLESEVRSEKSEVRIVEAGAHDGKLAADILHWLQSHRPKLFEQIEYIILEPSVRRQSWQRETLKTFPNVRWFSDFENLSLATRHSPLHGIIFSNELLDAFAVNCLGWDAEKKIWFEWGVASDGEKFVWAKIQKSQLNPPSAICRLPSAFLDVLPNGYTIETSPAAENWWRAAANILQRGKLLTIDYGFTDDEMFTPARINGTLRGYFRHHAAEDLLANLGEQDLTAHINFSVIQKIGEEAGLKTESFCTQPQFLTCILEKTLKDKSLDEWTEHRTRQFQTLTHPEHLGRAFRVLVQSRRS